MDTCRAKVADPFRTLRSKAMALDSACCFCWIFPYLFCFMDLIVPSSKRRRKTINTRHLSPIPTPKRKGRNPPPPPPKKNNWTNKRKKTPTLPETNIAPARKLPQKETNLPTENVSFREGTLWPTKALPVGKNDDSNSQISPPQSHPPDEDHVSSHIDPRILGGQWKFCFTRPEASRIRYFQSDFQGRKGNHGRILPYFAY